MCVWERKIMCVLVRKNVYKCAKHGFAITSPGRQSIKWKHCLSEKKKVRMQQSVKKVMLWQSSGTWKDPSLLIFLKKGATYYQSLRQNSLYLLNDSHIYIYIYIYIYITWFQCYHPGWQLMSLGYRTCFHTLYDEIKKNDIYIYIYI